MAQEARSRGLFEILLTLRSEFQFAPLSLAGEDFRLRLVRLSPIEAALFLLKYTYEYH